jgi:flagellin
LVFTAATAGTANGAWTITNTSSAGTAAITTTTANVAAVTAVTAVKQVDTLSLSGSFVEGDEIEISDGTNTLSYTVLAADLTGTDSENLEAISTKLAAKTLSGVAVAASSANGAITLTASTAGTANADFELTVTRAATTDLADIDYSDILTQDNSDSAIDAIDSSLAVVNNARAQMGATINRLTYAADNLTNVSQNTSESRSRIMDTDYAQATTELARTQIISQAATAMLAQANQAPQSVLSLLR